MFILTSLKKAGLNHIIFIFLFLFNITIINRFFIQIIIIIIIRFNLVCL